MFGLLQRHEQNRLIAPILLSPLKPKKQTRSVDLVARPPMPVRTERWVVMDASASVDGSYQEVACCYSSDDAFHYIDIHCDEDSHIEDKSVTAQTDLSRFRPAPDDQL